jgi:serine/threonine-protein kinase
LLVSGDTFRVTGLTDNKALRRTVISLLESAPPGAFTGTVDIVLGPRLLTLDRIDPLLTQFADCGPLDLVDPPAIGYGMGSRVLISGKLAETGSRVGLFDALTNIAGDRQISIDAEVLDPLLCLIESALPKAPPGGFDITFGFGDRPDPNPTGRYFVGENPVIDVTIPAEITDGFLWVSVLDVSGNVFHLLPNLNRPENAVAALREGATGPHPVRVAFSLSDASDNSRLAFLVDDTSLGKSKILAIHAPSQIFDGIRPTTESVASYAEALQRATANGEMQVQSLDSRVLTTAEP